MYSLFGIIIGSILGLILYFVFDAPLWASFMFGWLVADNAVIYLYIRYN